MSSYEYDTTMECRDNGVLCGVVRGRGNINKFYMDRASLQMKF